MDIRALAERAAGLVRPGERAVLGIAGPPGAGKTTLAEELVEHVRAGGIETAHVPMDGFHVADAVLAARGRLAAKGAIDTFDAHGYLALLRRLRTELDHDVLAPDFERTLEQPLAAAIAVAPAVRLVVTEGNYLLDRAGPWPTIRAQMDEVWFVDLDEDLRRSRLVERHIAFGKDTTSATAWVDQVDEPNVRRVVARRDTADLVVDDRA